MGTRPARFTTEQCRAVSSALTEAERLIGRYYCIPPRGWLRLPYDVLTQSDDGAHPLPEPVLAETRRVERLPGAGRAPYAFYRIQLNDESILAAADRACMASDLRPFLSYILTHEMVHLVRLEAILDGSTAALLPREVEEQRVERICHEVLRISADPGIRSLVAAFDPAPPVGPETP
jgi:hypothetical protein